MNESVKTAGVGWLVLVATLVAELVAQAVLVGTGAVAASATGTTWWWGATWTMLLAAPLAGAVSYGLARFVMRPPSRADAWPVGAVWGGIVGLTHLLLALGTGSLALFTSPGTWLLLAAVAAAPVLTVPRPAPGPDAPDGSRG